jgi:hypothetical protein
VWWLSERGEVAYSVESKEWWPRQRRVVAQYVRYGGSVWKEWWLIRYI